MGSRVPNEGSFAETDGQEVFFSPVDEVEVVVVDEAGGVEHLFRLFGGPAGLLFDAADLEQAFDRHVLQQLVVLVARRVFEVEFEQPLLALVVFFARPGLLVGLLRGVLFVEPDPAARHARDVCAERDEPVALVLPGPEAVVAGGPLAVCVAGGGVVGGFA